MRGEAVELGRQRRQDSGPKHGWSKSGEGLVTRMKKRA